MPRFFFDVSYADQHTTDRVGIDLGRTSDIPTEVYNVLRDIVQHEMPEGRLVLTVVVRDARGTVVYCGEMTINGHRLRS